MKQDISNEKIFNLVHPLFENHKYDKFKIPVMKRVSETMLTISNMNPINIQNLSNKYNNSDKIVLFFRYDNNLEKYWLHSLENVVLLQSAYAVATPDFTIHPQMEFPEYLHQIYKNRWLGCFWQEHGILAIPTVGWTTSEWDDLSFSGVEKGSVVIISTLGSKSDKEYFMRGYEEMIKRISPPLIIVYGDMLSEMKGRFINFPYKETFQKKNSLQFQEKLFDISPVFEVKEDYFGQQIFI